MKATELRRNTYSKKSTSLDFYLEKSLGKLEVHHTFVEETGLPEQSNSGGIKAGGESGVNRELHHALQINRDIRKVSRNVGTAYTAGQFNRRDQWIKP